MKLLNHTISKMAQKKPEQLTEEELAVLEFRQDDIINEIVTQKQSIKEIITKQDEVSKIFAQLLEKFNKIKL